MNKITEFSSMLDSSLSDIEQDLEVNILTIDFDEHIRRILEINDTLKDLPEIYSNHFTAIECLKQVHFNESRINITEEFLVRLGELTGDIELVRDRFNFFKKNLGWGYNGNFDNSAIGSMRFIHSSKEHDSLVSELASYTADNFMEDLSYVRNNLMIIYTLSEDSDITPEFILTRKSELLVDGERCNVLNTTSKDIEEMLKKGYEESIEMVGDFPILIDKLSDTVEVFENTNYKLADYETYKIQMDKLCEDIDGFICNNKTNGLSRGLLKQAVSEMVIQRGKGVALLTDKSGHFLHESRLLFSTLSGEYISNIPNLTDKINVIKGMPKLLLYKRQDNMFLGVLNNTPDITVICTHYCAFDESHRTFIKMKEDNRIPYNCIISAEEVMDFQLTGNQQSENRELLCRFAETREGGIDLNNCVFFKRDNITYIGVGCSLDIKCGIYLVPYEGSSEYTSVLFKDLSLSDLSSILPLDCTIFNTDRVNSLLDKVTTFKEARIYSKISSNMSVTLGPLTTMINKQMIDNNISEDKRINVVHLLVKKLDWTILLEYMDSLLVGASQAPTIDVSRFATPNSKGINTLTSTGVTFLRKVGILPKDKNEEQTLLMIINELISRVIDKDTMVNYVSSNLNLLEEYPECEKDLDYIKGLIGKSSREAKLESNKIIETILANNTTISSEVFSTMCKIKNSYINRLFAGYASGVSALQVDNESLRFVADKYPILLRHLKVLDFDYSKIGLTAFGFLSNFQSEDMYKRNNQRIDKELNVMRAVSQYNEFNIPVLTKNYIKGGQLSLYARGAKIEK